MQDLPAPRFRRLQLAVPSVSVPQGPQWLHETKYDGYRCLAALGRGGPRLYTRTGLDWTHRYGALPAALATLPCANALIDGEIVAATPGTSPFSMLLQALQDGAPLIFMAFDLLHLDGRSIGQMPLLERKSRLGRLLAGHPPAFPVRLAPHILGDGARALTAVRVAGGEGVVSKQVSAGYHGTRDGTWVKTKTRRRQEFVIGGWLPSPSRDRPFASLLVGSRDAGRLTYRGRVGGGFGRASLRHLAAAMAAHTRATSPFEAVPGEIARRARWVDPGLVAEVAFEEITAAGVVRHGVFIGLREDKPATEVAMEGHAATGDPAEPRILGIAISHPDRIVFPGTAIHKQDLAEYFARASTRLRRILADRPVTLLRCPDGVGGQCFFQRHHQAGLPAALRPFDITDSTGRVMPGILVRERAGLVAAAQSGVIEIHAWGSRCDAIELPDRLVFDLDPDPGLPFRRVRDAALTLRELFDDMGLPSVPMVTGGKGIHVIVPLRRSARWPTVTLFARLVALHLASRWPDRYLATAAKADREGRIYIDWRRNERGATAIQPWSPRARDGGPVAVPLEWSELPDVAAANVFDVRTATSSLRRACPLQAAHSLRGITARTVAKLEAMLKRGG